MAWWMWMLLGLGLLILEVWAFGGFFLMFFGIGALLVGTFSAVGLGASASLEWLLFSACSLAALALLRRPLVQRLGPKPGTREIDSLVGETAAACEPIAVGAVGKVELRGSSWSARNVGSSPLAQAQRCRVDRVEGLMLFICAE